jgi:hypothetical protein
MTSRHSKAVTNGFKRRLMLVWLRLMQDIDSNERAERHLDGDDGHDEPVDVEPLWTLSCGARAERVY